MKNFSRRSIRSSENSRRIRPASTKRRLLGELLEHRQLLAGDVVEVMPHHNYWAPTDVNQDARISPIDALAVVNDLNRNGARSLDNIDFAPTTYVDVNNDGFASPVDALQVINSLNRGVPEAVGEVVELQVGLRDLQGNDMLSSGSRTAQLSPGEFFNLELLYKDLRNQFQTPRGLASAYVDFLVNQPTAIEPVVTETHIADFSHNILNSPTGTIVIGVAGTSETATITGEQFTSGGLAPIAAAIQGLLDLSQPPTMTADAFTGTPGEPDILRVKVRYEGPEFFNTDVPDLTIDTSNLTAQGDPVTVSTRIVPAILPDGSVNGDAVAENLQTVSRTNGEEVYGQAVSGTYTETGAEAGFNEVGGFTSDFGIDDYAEPFHAFSILVRAVEAAENVVIQLDPPDGQDRSLIMQNVDQAVPNSQVLIDTDDNGAIPGDDRPGLVILNIVEGVTARPDTLTVQEDESGTVNVLTNDVNQISGPLSIASVGTAAHGTVSFSGGVVTYTPAADYFGPDSFTYVARNSQGDTGVGTVTVTVTADNDDPTFVADPVRNTTEDTPTPLAIPTAELLSNDSAGPNETGQTLSVTAVAATSNAGGTVTLSSGTINYTPPNHFNGTDRVTYTISDGAGGTTTGTVTISVAAVNDAPQLALSPQSVAEDATLSVAQSAVLGTSRPGPAGASDEASQTLLITSAGTAGATAQGGTVSVDGSGQITYDPADNFFGTDTFPITVTDSVGASTTGTVTVTVTAVNDTPIANNDSLVVDELSVNNVLNVLDNDSPGAGEDGQTVEITSLTPGANLNGTATISADGQSILYTPNSTFIGEASLSYVITDSQGLASAAATVTINVVAVIRPRAIDDSETVTEDSGTTTLTITDNDLANENETVTLESVSSISPSQGTLVQSGDNVEFTPAADFSGEVTFTYTISDTSNPTIDDPDEIAAATGTVTITVTPVNDNPVFAADPTLDAVEDTELQISAAALLANDSKGAANESGQTLSVSAVSGTSTAGGTVTLEGQTIVYLPAANFNGADSFTYTILDSAGGTTTGTATIDVDADNDLPVLALNPVSVAEDATLTVDQSVVLGSSTSGPATATDESSQTLQVTAVGTAGLTAEGGSVSINGLGQIVYTPADDFFGTDTFPITVTDSLGASTTGVVTVNVAAVNDAPVFGNPPLIAFSKTTMTFTESQLLANSTAGPANESNQTLSVVGATAIGGTTGTVVFNTDGTVTYTPAEDFLGEDQFQITISDGDLETTGVVTVDVQEFQPSVISGAVFFDYIESLSNQVRNGVQDDNEPGLQMANVRLVSSANANVTGVAIDLTLATSADGQFQFNNVPPGTYRLIFEVPEMVFDGADFAGTAGDLDSVQNQFTIEIEQPGGIDASGYNFTLYGTSGRAGNALDMLVSSYMQSQSSAGFTAASRSGSGLLGATAVLDSTGKTEWFKAGDGFEDVRFGEINLNAAADKATLTVVLDDGTVLTGWIPEDRFVFLRDPSGNTVVQIFGGLNDFNLVPDGTLDVSDADLLSYQSAVDQLLSQPGSVI